MTFSKVFTALAFTGMLAFGGWKGYRKFRPLPVVPLPPIVQVSDSTLARLATARLERDQFAGLLEAERALNGRLIAAQRLRVAARDTVIIHDTLPTSTAPDGTRTAQFKDSTFAGTIDGTITAPPSPAALAFSYTLHRPAFTPAVGIVRTADGAFYSVVTWQGERVTADQPFFKLPAPKNTLTKYASGAVGVNGDIRMAVGAEYKTPWWTGFSEVSVASRVPLGLWVGVRRKF